jgi:extracellular factor (EF) 3-hydroxypalmitic acid methyl ester biosynthesis protein
MPQKAADIRAHLEIDGKQIPIDVKYSSKYSLLVRFLNSNRFKNGEEFSKLVCHVNEDPFEVGPCKLISEPNIDGYAGRLICVNDIYDLENLFLKNEIVKLQSAFHNLPLVLAHKNKIKKIFKDYTADLTYDLSVYKNLFDGIDSEYKGEPEVIKNSIQRALINTEGETLMDFLDEKLAELERIVTDFDKNDHKHHGFYFRKQMWNYILCSPFMARTNLKPRGYSGDSEMMRMLYANNYQGDSTFAQIMHRHPLKHPAAQAVRNRRNLISKLLVNIKKKYRSQLKNPIKILSVACGPAFEIKDILQSEQDCSLYHFTLLDQDRHALFEAAHLITQIENSFETKIPATYLNESVRTMISTVQLEKKWGQFDYIYSMGLFDYLTPPAAKAVLMKLYHLLKTGGEMVIGNFHVSNPSKYYMEYWLDWVLYYRTEEEFIDLMGDISTADVRVAFEDTGSQMFLHVIKLD